MTPLHLRQRIRAFLTTPEPEAAEPSIPPIYDAPPNLTRDPTSTVPEYVTPEGDAYTLFAHRPNYHDADQPDEGQHDVWKKDLRIAIWRYLHGTPEPGTLSLAPLGLGPRTERVPVLFPLGEQLAEVSRKFGFLNLAEAAMPEAKREQLVEFYQQNAAAVRVEAAERCARNAATGETWDESRMGRTFTFDSESQVIRALSLGPLERPAGAVVLNPIKLRQPPIDYRNLTAVRKTP